MTVNIHTFQDAPAGDLSEYDLALHAQGIMKTIYVPVHPKVNEIKVELAKSAAQTVAMFQDPHRRTQDRMHEAFFETYIEWARPAAPIESSDFPFQYPTNGSNEAIRESIAFLATEARRSGKEPCLHVFEGEYEGYTAHAITHGVKIIAHDRANYESSLKEKFGVGDHFYMSAPSGIDGNIWGGYDAFLEHLERDYQDRHLMIDLAYLNTTSTKPAIRTNSPIIKGIFISMSKSFPGTYYDRIGGLLSKQEYPGLFGNKWFKNLNGLLLGVNLMKNSPLGEIPADMHKAQLQAIEALKPELGDDIKPSDVTFIATQALSENPSDLQKSLIRAGQIRYCLTPSIISILNS